MACYTTSFLNSKTIIVVLFWSFTAFFILPDRINTLYNYTSTILIIVPVIGWLGDIYLGRYRIIKYCMRILWISLIIDNIVITFVEVYSTVLIVFLQFIAAIGAVAAVLIVLCVVQLGIDQLTDASTSRIITFIQLEVWTYSFAASIYWLSTSCTCGVYTQYLSFFLKPLICTVAILCDIFLERYLIKETIKHNPLKLIFQVLRYAAKNKYPRLRSAFTYWEDKPYSRIDLGKSKYGGPFTTEQVEDVKTFFRLLFVLVVTFPYLCLMNSVNWIMTYFYLQFESSNYAMCQSSSSAIDYMKYCWNVIIIRNSSGFYISIFFPIIRLILNCFLKKLPCLVNVNTYHKLFLGMLFLIMCEISILTLEIVSLKLSPNINSTCIIDLYQQPSLQPLPQPFNANMNWLLVIDSLLSISTFLIFCGALEFLYAQALYSMRGFIFGIVLILYGSTYEVTDLSNKFVSSIKDRYVQTYSENSYCNIFSLVTLLLLTVIFTLCVAFPVKKCYKFRTRDEDLPNTQKFAVDYYEKYLPIVQKF